MENLEKAASVYKKTMRRRSWPVLGASVIALLWGMYALVFLAAVSSGDNSTAFLLGAVTLVVTAFILRISSSKVVAFGSGLIVSGPFASKRIPYWCIRGSEVAPSGGLVILMEGDGEVRPFAFSGSLVDGIFKTSECAAKEINRALKDFRDTRSGGDSISMFYRRFWPADAMILLALCLVVIAMVFV